jgi:hypothetical protein
MSRGDLVQAWWAAGRDSGWFYGIVEKCGQKTMTIRWESGLRQRLRRGEHDIRPISDPEIRAEMRKKLAKD